MLNSPDIRNYFIGKGQVWFKKDGESTYRHLGNVPEFEFTPEIETLEHFSSMEGVRSRDRTVTLSKSGTLRILAEEWTAKNLAIAVLGEVTPQTDGTEVIEIFSETAISGAIRLIGTNDVGSRFTWDLNKVDFIPGSSVSPISDEWGQLELTGECAAVNGSFGTITKTQNEGNAEDESEAEVASDPSEGS